MEKKNSEEILKKDVKKRTGVGYGREGSGKKWNVTEYYEMRKAKN